MKKINSISLVASSAVSFAFWNAFHLKMTFIPILIILFSYLVGIYTLSQYGTGPTIKWLHLLIGFVFGAIFLAGTDNLAFSLFIFSLTVFSTSTLTFKYLRKASHEDQAH